MRPGLDETMLAVALALSRRGTCVKAKVGCVLTDEAGNVLAANYNGVAAGLPHCNEEVKEWPPSYAVLHVAAVPRIIHPHACAGASAPPGSDLCEAVHAEQNALTRCLLPGAIHACYLATLSPCMRCTKQLLNTPCRRIVFLEEYAREPQAKELWTRQGREWEQAPPDVRLRLARSEEAWLAAR